MEQLKTHAVRLGVPLYERGYEKDPAKVAAEAVRVAERDGRNVVLVDTAGRMQVGAGGVMILCHACCTAGMTWLSNGFW